VRTSVLEANDGKSDLRKGVLGQFDGEFKLVEEHVVGDWEARLRVFAACEAIDFEDKEAGVVKKVLKLPLAFRVVIDVAKNDLGRDRKVTGGGVKQNKGVKVFMFGRGHGRRLRKNWVEQVCERRRGWRETFAADGRMADTESVPTDRSLSSYGRLDRDRRRDCVRHNSSRSVDRNRGSTSHRISRELYQSRHAEGAA
jgi:hypothetical protein